MADAKKELSFGGQVASLPANFWFACIIEMLERLAFFGVRAIAPLYLVASAGENGLGLSFSEKGIIYSVWAFLQCIIPMVSGGYSDRYGYRKSLAVAFVINIVGYLGMAWSKPLADYGVQHGWEGANFWVFMAAACLIATGTAIFKPPIAGTVAKTTNEETSSLGWGLFYWVVNIGGALAPMGAAVLRLEIDWQNVFYAAAIVTALNFLPAFLLYKEPDKGKVDTSKGPFAVFASSIMTLVRDLRLVLFLGIFSCFWLMFMQLWDLLPNFIDQWVNTSDVAGFFGWISDKWVLESGQTKPEIIINIDSISIIVLVVGISWIIRKINKVAAMIVGMLISLFGFIGAGATSVGVFCCIMVFVFSIGEMVCSPTFSAYIGLIAPKEKKALYMGYSNIPFAVGWGVGNLISGFLYDKFSNKFALARQYMVDHLGVDSTFAMDEKLLPQQRVMETLTFVEDGGDPAAIQQAGQAFWDQLPSVEVLTKEQSKELLGSLDGVLGDQAAAAIQHANQMLWDMHHPEQIWYYLGAIGLLGTIGMIIFYYATRNHQQGNSAEPASKPIFCTHCGKEIQVSADAAGSQQTCPDCGMVMDVPGP